MAPVPCVDGYHGYLLRPSPMAGVPPRDPALLSHNCRSRWIQARLCDSRCGRYLQTSGTARQEFSVLGITVPAMIFNFTTSYIDFDCSQSISCPKHCCVPCQEENKTLFTACCQSSVARAAGLSTRLAGLLVPPDLPPSTQDHPGITCRLLFLPKSTGSPSSSHVLTFLLQVDLTPRLRQP